jgi:protein O-GlcNAc transferase
MLEAIIATNPHELIAEGYGYHQRGDLLRAESLYRRAIEVAPGVAAAHYLLGLLEYQRGRHAAAAAHAAQAARAEPADARIAVLSGLALLGQGQAVDAVAQLRNAVQLDPRMADAHANLGNALRVSGQTELALASYRNALSLDPDNAALLNNVAAALVDLSRTDEALVALERASLLAPEDFGVAFNYGTALAAAGRHAQAREQLGRAAAGLDGYAGAWYQLGNACAATGDRTAAVAAYRRALALDGGLRPAWFNLGNALLDSGDAQEAEQAYARVLALDPAHAGAMHGLGRIALERGQPAAAEQCFRRALDADPSSHHAYVGLARVLQDGGQYHASLESVEVALALAPDFTEAHELRGAALWSVGLGADALAAFGRALELAPDSQRAWNNHLFAHNHCDGVSAARIAEVHAGFDRFASRAASGGAQPPRAPRAGRARTRVAYLSPDLRRHSVGYFAAPVIALHDRERFEVTCYFNHPGGDEVSERLREQVDAWVPCVAMDDAALARRIADDGIDILVDLAGHTFGNRLLAMARRPAPVQATWLGYPTTTGMRAIDWRITDALVDPEGSDALSTERLLRMPDSYFCYGGPDADTPVGELPALSRGSVRFGSFNNLAKLSPSCVALWSKVLRAVPDSTLVLKGKVFFDEASCDRVRDRFAAHGVRAERLDLVGWKDSLGAHLAEYADIDIALDPVPYNGATTTCEALWMGVPVVTLVGSTHVSRVGASLLHAVQLPELVTHSPERYAEVCAALARDPRRLALIRSGLRERMARRPLMDAPRFTRHLEAAYGQMLQAAGMNLP